MEEQKVIYHCKDCGADFETYQESHRRYCDKCLVKRVKTGGRIVKESTNEKP